MNPGRSSEEAEREVFRKKAQAMREREQLTQDVIMHRWSQVPVLPGAELVGVGKLGTSAPPTPSRCAR